MPTADDEGLALAAELQVEHFGEEIVYTPRGGAARPIKAVVWRRPPQPAKGGSGRPQAAFQQSAAPAMEIYVRNHAAAGVSSIDRDGDTYAIAERLGEAPKKWRVVEIVTQDAGGFHLRLR